MTPKLIRQTCMLDDRSHALLKAAVDKHGFTARACHRLLKVARTIADLAGHKSIRHQHVAEAIMYRALDRSG